VVTASFNGRNAADGSDENSVSSEKLFARWPGRHTAAGVRGSWKCQSETKNSRRDQHPHRGTPDD
jgi:hypothetical protein